MGVEHLVKMGVIWLFEQIWVWLVVLALAVILWLVDAWLERIRVKRRPPGRKR